MFADKFDLTLEQNVFLAKKSLVQTIYNSARLEGCNITYPETKTILDGVSVGGLSMDDVQCVVNLRNAWRYALDHINEPTTLEMMNRVNAQVSLNESLAWGELRTGKVSIGGTDYSPPVPIELNVKEELERILSIGEVTSRAIHLMLWIMRSQLYWDGNKRTAAICANHVMISHGKGIITIGEKHLLEFNQRLIKFYDTNDYTKLDGFIFDVGIQGMDIQK